MPNNITNLQDYLAGNHDLLASKGGSPEFRRYIETLKKLSDRTDAFYVRKNGQYKSVSQSDLNGLVNLYRSALDACIKYCESERDSGAAQVIQTLLYKDLNELAGVRAQPGMSLPDVIARARGKIISVRSADITTTGGHLSSRIPITYRDENGEVVEGFFTPATTHYNDEELHNRETMDNLRKRFPRIDSLVRKMEEYPRYYGSRAESNYADLKEVLDTRHIQGDRLPVKRDMEDRAKEVIEMIAHDMDMSPDSPDMSRAIRDFVVMMHSIHSDRGRFAQRARFYGDLNIASGTSIDNRNIATTAVSELLGCDSLVAESSPMTLQMDGRNIPGTFMKKAKGRTLEALNPENRLLHLKVQDEEEEMDALSDDVYDHCAPALSKDLLIAQVNDFICRETDRHAYNMSFEFSGKPGEEIITGIQCLDNDASFGRTVIKTDDEGKEVADHHMAKSDQLLLLPESFAKRIKSVRKEEFFTAIRGTIRDADEMKAAWERLLIVRGQILEGEKVLNPNDNKLIPGVIRTAPDKEFESKWSMLSFRSVVNHDQNIKHLPPLFAKINHLAESAKPETEKTRIKYAPAQIAEPELDRDLLAASAKKMDQVFKTLDAVSSVFYGKQDFENILTKVKEVRQLGRTLPENPTPEQYKNYYDQVRAASGLTAKYLDYKLGAERTNTEQLSTRGQKRVVAVEKAAEMLRDVEMTLYDADRNHASLNGVSTMLTDSSDDTLVNRCNERVEAFKKHILTIGHGPRKDFANRAMDSLEQAFLKNGKMDMAKAKEAMAAMIAFEHENRTAVAHEDRGIVFLAAMNTEEVQLQVIRGIQQEPAFKKLTEKLTPEKVRAFFAENGEREYLRKSRNAVKTEEKKAPAPAKVQTKQNPILGEGILGKH